MTAAKKRVTDQIAMIKPAEVKAAAAKKTADAAKVERDAVQKQVDVFKAKTAKTRGANQPKTAKAG